ncbi:MAG: hypothetical protein KDA65_10295 [Planctomycetaceae bacterium]|nr:hypothetical protein [Planctomycetaceae bacterium]
MEKVNVTCRLNADDIVFLDKLATLTERDRSYLIKKAVSEFIALQKWQIEEVEAALVEAEGGEFVTAREVKSAFQELQK